MNLGASVTGFKATLNRVENIPWNTEDLFLNQGHKTNLQKQNKIKADLLIFFFFKDPRLCFYLQSLQLLQILEGASLDDAHLIVFQMPGIRKAARVRD